MSTIIVLITAMFVVSAQAQSCYRTLKEISDKELVRPPEERNKAQEYMLCPNTIYEPGTVNANGIQGESPLILRSKAFVKCGTNGKSSNNCIIRGTGTFGVWVDPVSMVPFDPTDLDRRNVIIKGVTFRDFVTQNQLNTVIFFNVPQGKLTLDDCIFSNVGSSMPFFFAQTFYDLPSRKLIEDRYGNNHDEMNALEQTLKNGYTRAKEILEENNSDHQALLFSGDEMTRAEIDNRGLQQDFTIDDFGEFETGALNINIQNCVFANTTMVEEPRSLAAFSILYFTGFILKQAVSGSIRQVPTPGNMNVRIFESRFENIHSTVNPLVALPNRRSIIDFLSNGGFYMRNTCFDDISVVSDGVEGVIFVHQGSTWLDRGGNSILNVAFNGPIDENPSGCPFMSSYDLDLSSEQPYGFLFCIDGFNLLDECPLDGDFVDEPAPAPATGGGLVICFSSENLAQLANGETKRFDQLQLGDKVLTRNGYESIYSFGHYNQQKEAEFVQLLPSRIELSSTHLVFLNDSRAVPADDIKVGDILLSGEKVTGKRYVKRQGLFAPFTASGTIVANGQIASSYTSMQGTVDFRVIDWSTGISHQWMAHSFEFPHRLWCYAMKESCWNESYTQEGISTWVSMPHKFFTRYLNSQIWIRLLLAVPILGIFGVFSFLDYMMMSEGKSIVALSLICVIWAISYHCVKLPFCIQQKMKWN
mmetsp:Transcript_17108/g.25920  ORF Transcript_17108/g.25920 Transcript_17108/m.25920 type:complete len:702 (+) Transcript_17108:42-2147(+)